MIFYKQIMVPSTLFAERCAVAKKWLKDCENKHEECIEHALVFENDHRSYLPTRVVDLQGLAESKSTCLEVSSRVGPRRGVSRLGRYVALSHRWPTGSCSWVTTKENLHARMNRLSMSDLPQTLQDCIYIVAQLGIRYLWIDSICIIQDSAADWELESSQMTDIYGGATMTVFADGAADDNAGMFRPQTDTHEFGSISNDGGTFETLVNRSLLSTRAWIFQERFMSRRILHITSEQMVWECRSCLIAESAPSLPRIGAPWLGKLVETLRGVRLSKSALMAYWPRLVEEYTQRKLTLGKDKLPALSGLANYIATRTDYITTEDYIAGMWRGNLKTDLLWESSCDDPDHLPRRPSEWRAPTWSWASIDGPVVYTKADTIFQNDKDFEPTYGGVGDPHVTIRGHDRYGQITSASLWLKGNTRWVKVSRPSGPSLRQWEWEIYSPSEPRKRLGVFTQDVEGEIPLDGIAMCLRAAHSDTPGSICLILAPVEIDGEPAGIFYQRIGIGSLEPVVDSEADWYVLDFILEDLGQYPTNHLPS